jgi:hypothetical protein
MAVIDRKDGAFPSRVVEEIGIPTLQTVAKKLSTAFEELNPNALALMGDYTSRGDSAPLAQCLTYLRGLLPVRWTEKPDALTLCLIGNHDLDRRVALAGGDRFGPINTALNAAGFPSAPADSLLRLDWTGPRGEHAALFGLNSCLGCGEVRRFSEVIRADVAQRIKEVIEAGSDPKLMDQLIDNLDTPAVSEAILGELRSAGEALPVWTVPLVCAHHNLLPQATPRIAPYAELINGGSIRSSLLSLDRPIIFLHGHLHDDPIEVIRAPGRRRAAIISISAPLLRDGFNVIEVAYSMHGVPLGCRVVQFRRSGNQVERRAPVEIPLWPTLDGLQNASPRGRELMAQLEDGRLHLLADLGRAMGLPETELIDCAEELRWLGVMEVRNEFAPQMQWRVLRAI